MMEDTNPDLMVNNLIYRAPTALSLATHRTYKKNFFQRDTYTGDRSTTMVADLNTGTSFLDPYNSYLSFQVTLTGTTPTANFGSGSAMNVINELRLQSRSGVELSRDQNVNLWSKYDDLYTKPTTHLTTTASTQGYGPTLSSADAANLSATPTRFNIPLGCLSLFFRPLKGQLVPPQISSGLHFEMVLEDFRTALFEKSGTVTGYNITGLYFQLCLVDMSDDTQKAIMLESSQNGLEYAYSRIFTSVSQLPVNQTTINAQVRKAVSIANYAYAIATSAADRIDVTKDSLTSITFNYDDWQFRIGSQFFPNQIVTSASDGVETYEIAQQTFDKIKHVYSSGSVSLTTFKSRHGIVASNFESSSSLSVAGCPINNSRTLELNANLSSVPESLELIIFLEYSCVARAFIDNISCSI